MSFLKMIVVIAGFCLVFLSCWPAEEPEPPSYTGMRFIPANGRFFTMGAEGVWAGVEEQPPMRVGFGYDFWIDTVEVTVERYYRLTGALPAGIPATDSTALTPVRFVSWFDAILFCNLRSIDEGFDTVYAYESCSKTANGRTYRIDGLKTDLSVTGYRLPTEAEWEFAARGGVTTVFPWGNEPDTAAAARIAWYGNNSGDAVHPVGLLAPTPNGLYDMFGNVVEWVNDYKGIYGNDTIINFVGPSSSGTESRPVKGGAVTHTIERIRASSRTDVYATLSSTAARYIGFRCCIGAVPPQQGGVLAGAADSANPVRYVGPAMSAYLPHGKARMVFVNRTGRNGHLGYIDLGEDNPRVRCYTDFSPVYAPTISPDGQWVAFSTRDEGSLDGSDIYIRKLDNAGSMLTRLNDAPAFIPRWWTDTTDGSTWLVYTGSAVDNAVSLWSTTVTKMQKIANGAPVGSPVTIDDAGSYHGGLSVDKKYLATGYTRLIMKNRETGERRTLFTGPQNGKAPGDTSQVCNVSIAPRGGKADRVMFLDFGSGSTPSTLTGGTYFTHEIIFVADFSGDVAGWYRCPPELVQWNYPEWSTHPDFAAATGMPVDAPQSNRDIYVINLADTTSTRVLEGVELQQPYLWISAVKGQQALALDSLGYYNEPPTSVWQSEFAAKLPEYWKYHDSIEVLCLGSSRIESGICPALLDPLFTYNFGYAGGGLEGIVRILDNYVFLHSPRVKVVIVSMDICWYRFSGGDSTWVDIRNSKGYRYDESNGFWSAGLPEGFVDFVNQVEHPFDPAVVENRGWAGAPSEGWGADPSPWSEFWKWEVDSTSRSCLLMLDSLINRLSARNIHMIGVIFPMSPTFKNTPVYGTYGPTRAAARQIIEDIRQIDSAQTYFHFYDYNMDGDHPFTGEDAYNASHLSTAGAQKITGLLKGVVDSLFAEGR